MPCVVTVHTGLKSGPTPSSDIRRVTLLLRAVAKGHRCGLGECTPRWRDGGIWQLVVLQLVG